MEATRERGRREPARTGILGCCVLAFLLQGCTGPFVPIPMAERRAEIFGGIDEKGAPTGQEWSEQELEKPDLETWIRFGLRNNAGLRAAFEGWRGSLEKIPQVTALPDPVVGFATFLEEIQTRTGPQRNRFGLSQTFPWFGKLDLRGKVAAKEAEARWFEVKTKRLEVIEKIKKAWFEYGFLAHSIRITEDNLELLKRLEPIVQRRIQGGAGQEDLLKLQVEIGKIENSLETLRKFRPALSARLGAVLNRKGKGLLPFPELTEPDPLEVSTEDLAKELLGGNPELESIRQRLKKARNRVELAKLMGWPDITLGVDYLETGDALNPGTPGSGNDPLALRLMFNLPIWRGKYSAAEREALRAESAMRRGLVETGNNLEARLAMGIYRLDDASRQVVLYRDTLIPRARQALEVTETSYRGGTATILDVIDSERVLLAFEKAYWRACSDFEQSTAEIEALIGGDLK